MNRPIIEKKFLSLSISVDRRFALIAALILALTACGKTATSKPRSQDTAAAGPAAVDNARMLGAARNGADWLSYGRTYSEQRFSPLHKINTGNVGNLGQRHAAWFSPPSTSPSPGRRHPRSRKVPYSFEPDRLLLFYRIQPPAAMRNFSL